ncbi:glyoxalase-like domain protein [Leptothoe sp. PORK10 BA2]|uniref:glyoxalase-like domain protein n=1 Tax=Leptothoe sp. PORK10 BA2 TaxID=3110254 RepID=UPI002B21C26C|nr:glyoxalase-like domain protein [Leptothoe sp. PORK10 BA2]MEA5463038.1 glyoxalase-like domain protein [Leptothoe sp. PORK10 BA2]
MIFYPTVSSPHLASIWQGLPLDSLVSTQGIMVMLLVAYAGAMWVFLTSAPKVHTVMVSDLELARQFYEGMLDLSAADVPLHYYYNYEQTMGAGMGMEPMMGMGTLSRPATPSAGSPDGLWYQLKKNTQLHVIAGASRGHQDRQRHVCFDRDCLELLLLQVQANGVRHKIRRERPLNFLVKNYDGEVIEMAEVGD